MWEIERKSERGMEGEEGSEGVSRTEAERGMDGEGRERQETNKRDEFVIPVYGSKTIYKYQSTMMQVTEKKRKE